MRIAPPPKVFPSLSLTGGGWIGLIGYPKKRGVPGGTPLSRQVELLNLVQMLIKNNYGKFSQGVTGHHRPTHKMDFRIG